MKIKIMKHLSLAVMLLVLGLCFVGCSLNPNDDPSDNPANITYTIDSNFKTTYYIGEDLDCKNAYIHYTENEQDKTLKFDASNITGFDTSTIGTFTMNIRVDNIRLSTTYKVKDYEVIEIVELRGMTYEFKEGDSISLTGVKAVLKLSNNTLKEINVNSTMFTNLSTSTIGENKTFTFTYDGISKNFNYSVTKNVYVITGVTGIEVKYCVGDELVLNNAEVTYIKNGTETGTWSIFKDNITNFSTTTKGTRTLQINTLGTTYSLEYQVYQLNNLVANKLYYYQCNDTYGKYIYVYVSELTTDGAYLYIGFSSATPSTVKSNPTAVSTTNLKSYSITRKNSFTSNSNYYDTAYSTTGSIQLTGYKFIIGFMDASGSACTVSYYSSVQNSTATATYRLSEC